MSAKKRTLNDYYNGDSSSTPSKKKRKVVENVKPKKKEMNGHMKKKPTKWTCRKVWQFDANGGIYDMQHLSEASQFLKEKGFVVIKDVMDAKENSEGRAKLLSDIQAINQHRKDVVINDLSDITNKHLPGWSSNGIRLQFSISHGEFAHFSRLRPNLKKIFACFHECKESELNCSWDSIAVTPSNAKHKNTLWLHADQSIYNEKNKKIDGWNFKSIQGALYYTPTNEHTVSFVCCPESHKKYWRKLADKAKTKTKHWILLDEIISDDVDDESKTDQQWKQMKADIMEHSYRIHVPQNSFLLWDSKVFHQNGDALKADTENKLGVKRIASFVCMAPIAFRTKKAFKNSLVFAINGSTSTHWPQFMKAHGSKHPRFSRGNCYENMCDIKPTLNPDVTEEQFQQMVPKELKQKKVKIYNSEEMKAVTLDTVHHLGMQDLSRFKVADLWELMHPRLRALQPWMQQ